MKKVLSVILALVLACSLPATAGAADNGFIGVMLKTNVMSLDTHLATDGESFEVIADCIDGLTQMDASGAAIPTLAENCIMAK